MIDNKTLTMFGLTQDDNNEKLKEFFKDNIRLKEVHIDTYTENPITTRSSSFMLLLRLIEKQMTVLNDGKRLILKKEIDKLDTYFVNVLFSEIKECYFNISKSYSEFILKIQNIYFKVTVLN